MTGAGAGHSSFPMSYALYQPMIRDAAARPAIWRLFLGVVTAAAVFFLWMAGIVFLLGLGVTCATNGQSVAVDLDIHLVRVDSRQVDFDFECLLSSAS